MARVWLFPHADGAIDNADVGDCDGGGRVPDMINRCGDPDYSDHDDGRYGAAPAISITLPAVTAVAYHAA